jgi:hypothetical protein
LRGRDRDAEEYKDSLQRIVELSMQLGKYVTDLLFLARAETAHLQFEWGRLDLAELVVGAAVDFEVMAEEGSMTVKLDAPTTTVWVQGDKQRLRHILGDNACRYSNPGGHVAATLRTDGKEAIFSLGDQGIGIPAQDLDRTTTALRSKNARQSRDDGSGLGLAMARSIIKAHGGQITVASIENSGSTFTVTLPLVYPEQAPSHDGQPPKLEDAESGYFRILLVEDDLRIVDFVRRGLKAEGYAVEVARNGQEAMSLGTKGRFQAIILDLGLPDIHGREVCGHNAPTVLKRPS